MKINCSPFALIALMLFSQNSISQVDLFTSVEIAGGVSPPPTANAIYNVVIDIDVLKTVPGSLVLSLPGQSTSFVPMTNFIPRKGYEYRDDETDPPGTPEFWPIPNLPADGYSYMWAGRNDDYDVVITVVRGRLTARIYGNTQTYGIYHDGNNTYKMNDIRPEGFPSEAIFNTSDIPNDTSDFEEVDSQTFMSDVKLHKISNIESNQRNQGTVLDMLIVWTEEARIDAGGNPNDANDTLDIELLMTSSVDNANQAFSNSQMNTFVTELHTAKLNGFVTAIPLFNNLVRFKDLSSVQSLRNQIGADIVSGIVQDYDSSFHACGIAYVQTYPECEINFPQQNCGVGSSFDSFSYNLISRQCSTFDNSFTHELGHLLGGNHARTQLSIQWINAVYKNGFPDAFGLHNSSFGTIMSTAQPTESRRLNFSNPNVSINVNGQPIATGTLNVANNARVIDELSPAMSIFRDRPDLIFANGFDL